MELGRAIDEDEVRGFLEHQAEQWKPRFEARSNILVDQHGIANLWLKDTLSDWMCFVHCSPEDFFYVRMEQKMAHLEHLIMLHLIKDAGFASLNPPNRK